MTIPVIQPSGKIITAHVAFDGHAFRDSFIFGPVSIIEEGVITLGQQENPLINVLIKELFPGELFDQYREQIARLYCQVFSEPPYFERFSLEEAEGILSSIIIAPDRLFFIACDGENVIGFGAGLPTSYNNEVASEIIGRVDPKDVYYMAELGVNPRYRGQGISNQLIDVRLKRIPSRYSKILVRTSVENTATRYLYITGRGFKEIPDLRHVIVNRKYIPGQLDFVEAPDERLFFIAERIVVQRDLQS